MDWSSACPLVVPQPAPMEAPPRSVAGIEGARRATLPRRGPQESLQGLDLPAVDLRLTF